MEIVENGAEGNKGLYKPNLDIPIQQRRLLENIVENIATHSNASMSELARQAGYSEASARTASEIIAKPSFQALLEEMLPDSYLLNAQKDLIENAQSENVKYQSIRMAHELKSHFQPVVEQHNHLTLSYSGAPEPTEKQLRGEYEDVIDILPDGVTQPEQDLDL